MNKKRADEFIRFYNSNSTCNINGRYFEFPHKRYQAMGRDKMKSILLKAQVKCSESLINTVSIMLDTIDAYPDEITRLLVMAENLKAAKRE